MAERTWKKKRKAHGVIYVAEGIDRAIVDNKGLGFNPGISWNGQKFPSVEAAQKAAEAAHPLKSPTATRHDEDHHHG